MGESDWRAALADRGAYFAVKVRPAKPSAIPGELHLAVTLDGNNWNCISMMPDEIDKIINALKAYQAAIAKEGEK